MFQFYLVFWDCFSFVHVFLRRRCQDCAWSEVALEGAAAAAWTTCTNGCLSQERGSPHVSQWHPPNEVVEEAMISTWGLHLVSRTRGWKDKSFSVLPSCPETFGWLVVSGHCPVRGSSSCYWVVGWCDGQSRAGMGIWQVELLLHPIPRRWLDFGCSPELSKPNSRAQCVGLN